MTQEKYITFILDALEETLFPKEVKAKREGKQSLFR